MKIKLRSLLFPTRFASKRIGYATLLAAATFVFAFASLALWRPASLAAKSNRQSCPHCGVKSNQMIYLPLIALPEAQGSELVFNSRSPQAMDVTPTFYKLDGTAIVGKSVSVQSAEIRYVDLKKLIPGQYRNDTDWGGMSLAYYGVTREMWAQFRLLGINGGGSVDEFFTVPSEVRSDLQEAVWWTPPNSTAIVALGNITDTATSATLRFGDGQEQSVKLAPHATEVIRHAPRSQATGESVAINITGAAGSVIPTGAITLADGSFNSVIRFYETKLAKQPDLFANGMRLAGVEPHLVLKNTSSNAVKATPKFIPLAGNAAGGLVELPAVIVKANEAVEVDLSALFATVQSRRDLDTVSVTVSNSGAPGSLIGALYSSNKTTGVNYEVPLRDSGPPRSMTGAYPWKISDDYTTIVYLTNISDHPTEFVAQINYDGGKYVLGIQKLAAGETAMFDMQQMIAEQKPDDGKRTLPKDLQSGQFKWLVHGVTGGKVILIGRAEMVSLSQRISTSYSCAENCITSYTGGIDPASMVAAVGSTHAMSAWEEAQYASGSTLGPYGTSGTWSSNNTSIATITSGGSCSAVAAGQATIHFQSGFLEVYSWDGLNCVDIGPTQWDADSGVTAVEVEKIQYQSDSTFTDISGTLYVLKGTAVTFKAIPTPTDADWPTGKPVWAGTAGTSGTGSTKSVTFNTLSTSTTDYKTVTAESGNTVTVNVIVYELIPQLTPQDNFSGRSTTDFGIAEFVDLSFTTTPIITQTQIGDLEWIDADSNLINTGTTGTGTYFSPMTAGSATLDLRINNGPSKNQKRSSNRNIVAPSGGYMTQASGTGIRHTQNKWSVGFLGSIYFLPKNVSFAKLEFSEGLTFATATGYLSVLNGQRHDPGVWLTIGNCNISTGCKVNGIDQAWTGELGPPYSNGTFNWPIPWQYRKSASVITTFYTANQSFTADSVGTATIQKAGAGPFSRVPSDPTSSW